HTHEKNDKTLLWHTLTKKAPWSRCSSMLQDKCGLIYVEHAAEPQYRYRDRCTTEPLPYRIKKKTN
ncbi:MAG: hypothetical protein Q4F52_09155, partial [Bacteroidaceae bacterium]|nr:hypothetical protein [Bacteroidaceae bacterium]